MISLSLSLSVRRTLTCSLALSIDPEEGKKEQACNEGRQREIDTRLSTPFSLSLSLLQRCSPDGLFPRFGEQGIIGAESTDATQECKRGTRFGLKVQDQSLRKRACRTATEKRSSSRADTSSLCHTAFATILLTVISSTWAGLVQQSARLPLLLPNMAFRCQRIHTACGVGK